jgi:hypothetical protein
MHAPPCFILLYIFIQSPEGIVYSAVEHKLGGSLLDLFGGYLTQKCNGVVVYLAPEMGVQVGEEAENFRMPCPPKILRQREKPFMKRHV